MNRAPQKTVVFNHVCNGVNLISIIVLSIILSIALIIASTPYDTAYGRVRVKNQNIYNNPIDFPEPRSYAPDLSSLSNDNSPSPDSSEDTNDINQRKSSQRIHAYIPDDDDEDYNKTANNEPITVSAPKELDWVDFGWCQLNGSWYFIYKPSRCATGPWTINFTTYWFDKNGVMQTGWQKQDSKWAYFGIDGKLCTQWQEIAGKWYYLGKYGVMQTGWIKNHENQYYLGTDGAMRTGWIKHESNWYYFDSEGVMQTGWLQDNGTWYYLSIDGTMQTNTIVDGWELDSQGRGTKK